jgi:phospholipid/cholesterol/gamma-HCH transport system permease protein
MLYMGVNSIPLVFLTSLFTGAVTSVQAAYQFTDLLSMRYLGSAVGKAVIIELGPVLTALVVTGRVGASIAAELGTMKVTEQIDALESMALNPTEYLVVPRFVSGLLMLPVLTIFADFIAILGGLAVAVSFLNVTSHTFLTSVKSFFEMTDLLAGLTKSFAFGAIISIIGCFQGFKTTGGAEGVGRSTTMAVVVASVLILITDYILASLIFGTG